MKMLRRRVEVDTEKIEKVNYEIPTDTPNKRSIHTISSIVAILFIILGVLLFDFVVKYNAILPKQLKITDEKNHPGSFIGERSQNHLKQLVSIGQKVTGSYENEVLAVDFLKREINFVIQQANRNQKIELDHQIVSGEYFLGFVPFGLVNNYVNVQNIVVRLASENASNSSLLVNCHFDSVPSSPGASDDGINCATMLEIIRVLSKESKRPKHNIIFLFNGAEENPLQASHGFILKHKWAKECRAVINLEAAGLAEKEIVFQAGPGNSFLINCYKKSAPWPFGQSFGEEMFKQNLIPSDTDLRIFRDFGHIPGLDMAFAKNGYIYHTKHDDFYLIKPGAYQHVGDNVLALVRCLSESDELQNTTIENDEISIYFDYLGLFMIAYSQTTAIYINAAVCILSIIVTIASLVRLKQGTKQQLFYEIFLSVFAQTGGWVLSILASLLIAYLLDQLNLTMSWYTRPKIIFGLYSCPTLLLSSFLLLILNQYYNNKEKINVSVKTQINCHALRMMFTLFLLLNTIYFIRASYSFLIPTIFGTLAHGIIFLFKLEHTRRVWIYIYSICMLIPTIFYMYAYSVTMQLFIPITGRIGNDKNPELFIALASAVYCIIISNSYIALVTLLRKPYKVVVGLVMIFIITICLIAFTNYGFPYGDSKDLPTPQRYWIFHTARKYHNEKGEVFKNDSGYFMLNLDRNSPRSIEEYVPEMKNLEPLDKDCDIVIFCGLPIYSSRMISIHKESTWIPAPPPVLHEPISLELVSKTAQSSNMYRFQFEIKGPDHMAIFFSPKLNVELKNWSFVDNIPHELHLWQNRSTYFILQSYGVMPEKPYTFWLDLETPEKWNGSCLDIVLTGQYTHHDKSRTKDFQNFLDEFPSWTHVTAWMTNYHSWIY